MGPGAARAGPRMTPWAVTATIAKSIAPLTVSITVAA